MIEPEADSSAPADIPTDAPIRRPALFWLTTLVAFSLLGMAVVSLTLAGQ